MTFWLDTETLALLQKSPTDKLAPADTIAFTLVALTISDRCSKRVVRAIERILDVPPEDARHLLARPLPFPVKRELSHADAAFGQFELISCDSISVILTDEVFDGATPKYLNELYGQLLQSPEFEIISLQVESIPETERGSQYIDQFLGNDDSWRSSVLKVHRKKALIMKYWGAKIGGVVTLLE
jgi:hypothetical protein